jgi:hypothetical protein
VLCSALNFESPRSLILKKADSSTWRRGSDSRMDCSLERAESVLAYLEHGGIHFLAAVLLE